VPRLKSVFRPGSFHSRPTSQVVHPWRTAALIGGVYILVAGLYIIGSSQYVAHRASSIGALRLSELEKGLTFVIVTGLGLILLIRGLLQRVSTKQSQILQQRNALMLSERHAVAGILASSVAHDMNNLLTTLISAFELLSMEVPNAPLYHKRFEQIRKTHRQMEELTGRLMHAGKSHPVGTPNPITLNALIGEALAFAKSHQDMRHCQIHVHCPGTIELTGYPDLLRQALFNLLLNAAQATAGRGEIMLQAHRSEDRVELVIADDGPGIPEGERARIFQPFYTTKPEGTGLGMLSIQACAEAHHGEITVGASSLGGAQFTLRLPHRSL